MVGYLWLDRFNGTTLRQKSNCEWLFTFTTTMLEEYVTLLVHTEVLALCWSKNNLKKVIELFMTELKELIKPSYNIMQPQIAFAGYSLSFGVLLYFGWNEQSKFLGHNGNITIQFGYAAYLTKANIPSCNLYPKSWIEHCHSGTPSCICINFMGWDFCDHQNFKVVCQTIARGS